MGFLGNQFRFGGQLNLTLTSSTRTLTQDESFHRLIVIDSATENCTLTFPLIGGADWVVINNSPDYVVTCNVAGGASSVIVYSLRRATLYCDADGGLVDVLGAPNPIGGVQTTARIYANGVTTASLNVEDSTSIYNVRSAITGTSANATTFTLATYTPPPAQAASGVIEFTGGCRNVSTGDTHVFKILTGFKVYSGAAAVYGDVASALYEASGGVDTGDLAAALSTAIVFFDASGATVRVRATGVAATNLSWWGRLVVTGATVT